MPDLNDDLRAYGAALAERLEGADVRASDHRRDRRPRRLAVAALGIAAAAVTVIAITISADTNGRNDDVTAGKPPSSSAAAPTDTHPSDTAPATTQLPPPTCQAPSPEPGARSALATTFLHCGPPDPSRPLVAVERAVPGNERPLTVALEELMAGATPDETAAGLTSGVPEAALGAPVTARIDPSGVATVDVDYDFSTINNFSTSNATLAFVEPLWATVLQFDSVTAVDLGDFCAATELDCGPLTRDELEQQLAP